VKQRRQELGWSQIQAAEHFQVHQATWSRLERGRVQCMPALLKRLTQWLAATPTDDAPDHDPQTPHA
jgi:predicted transcriptional regulator